MNIELRIEGIKILRKRFYTIVFQCMEVSNRNILLTWFYANTVDVCLFDFIKIAHSCNERFEYWILFLKNLFNL
jgi:hypothetical protein